MYSRTVWKTVLMGWPAAWVCVCVCVQLHLRGGKTAAVGIQPLSYYRTDEEKIDVRRRGLRAVTRLVKKQLLPSLSNTHTHTPLLWMERQCQEKETDGGKNRSPTHEGELKWSTALLSIQLFLCELWWILTAEWKQQKPPNVGKRVWSISCCYKACPSPTEDILQLMMN